MHDKQFAYDFHYGGGGGVQTTKALQQFRECFYLFRKRSRKSVALLQSSVTAVLLTIYGLFLAAWRYDYDVGWCSYWQLHPTVLLHVHLTTGRLQLKRRFPSNFHYSCFAFFPDPTQSVRQRMTSGRIFKYWHWLEGRTRLLACPSLVVSLIDVGGMDLLFKIFLAKESLWTRYNSRNREKNYSKPDWGWPGGVGGE